MEKHRSGIPARNKLEAVTRISRLYGGPPESLGPGSKERKSVLTGLARALHHPFDQRLAKPQLGESIAGHLDVPWDGSCFSTGSTVTLEGLNRLLLGAEPLLTRAERAAFATPRAEAEAILAVLAAALPAVMDGRECVTQMREAEFSQWAQDEWPGFYFEYVGLPACISALGGGPAKYANTRFDYSLGRAWDFKWHGGSPAAPLNDMAGVEAAVEDKGLGFVLLSGDVEYDDGQLREWFRAERLTRGKRPVPRSAPPRFLRKSKARFTPRLLEAFHLRDMEDLREAVAAGALGVMAQGRQVTGAARKPKYALRMRRARELIRISSLELGS